MGVGGGASGGVEWRGVALVHCAGEVDRGRGDNERWRSKEEL
jgi:hypothetical protein